MWKPHNVRYTRMGLIGERQVSGSSLEVTGIACRNPTELFNHIPTA